MTWTRAHSAVLILAVGTIVAVWMFFSGRAGQPPQPIVVSGNRLTVVNSTSSSWQDVEIWLNIHYRIMPGRIEAGQRLDAPLDAFVAGFGQRFDSKRQRPQGVEVNARTADNRAIRLVWGKGRKP